jgi:DNA-binding NarL/FixJ family response regulator
MTPTIDSDLAAPAASPLGPFVAQGVPPQGPRVALVVSDPRRARQLESVLDRAEAAAADVLVIDLEAGAPLPGALAEGKPLLVLTDDARLAADQGIAGVLPREAPASRIVAAVAAIAAGLQVRQPAAREKVGLTPRERDILACLGEGLSNKAIARRLGISAHTVKYHLEAVFAKLGANTRAEALSQGLRRGVVAL